MIVVGGGVAGLAAALALGREGISVQVLEARERLGGRVFTRRPRGWPGPVELGAEFIHEGNEALWALLREHKLRAARVPEAHWNFHDGTVHPLADVAAQIGRVMRRIQPRRMRGWSFRDFLRAPGAALRAEGRELAAGFVEGFEAAPQEKMSAAAVAGETLEPGEQYVLPGGYARLVEALAGQLPCACVRVRRQTVVRAIAWRRGEVIAQDGERVFSARAAILTLPLGVLQARPPQRGAVRFQPGLGAKQALVARMQVGHVIRLTVRFAPRAWPVIVPLALQRAGRAFGFIHSRIAGVPVWWSLGEDCVLTGWAGGPAAVALARRTEEGVTRHALRSLAEIFGTPAVALQRAWRGHVVHNWSRDPFSRGAYSFAAAGLDDAAERLREPLEETLFFAGEATADGAEIGTVHGALAWAPRAAEEVRRVLR